MNVCFQIKKVTTRKLHQCFGCLRKFDIKTVMSLHKGVFERDFYNYYLCETCENLLPILTKDYCYGEGIEEGFVLESKRNKDKTPEQFLVEITQSLTT